MGGTRIAAGPAQTHGNGPAGLSTDHPHADIAVPRCTQGRLGWRGQPPSVPIPRPARAPTRPWPCQRPTGGGRGRRTAPRPRRAAQRGGAGRGRGRQQTFVSMRRGEVCCGARKQNLLQRMRAQNLRCRGAGKYFFIFFRGVLNESLGGSRHGGGGTPGGPPRRPAAVEKALHHEAAPDRHPGGGRPRCSRAETEAGRGKFCPQTGSLFYYVSFILCRFGPFIIFVCFNSINFFLLFVTILPHGSRNASLSISVFPF